MKTTFVRNIVSDGPAAQELFEMEKPIKFMAVGESEKTTKFVIASSVLAFGTDPEVLIFPADKDGKILSFLEIWGWRGTLNIQMAMEEFGNVA